MIPLSCQSWTLNRTNITGCMFSWRNAAWGCQRSLYYWCQYSSYLSVTHSAWQPIWSIAFQDIWKWGTYLTDFFGVFVFLETLTLQFNRLNASWLTLEFHCRCLCLSVLWLTWHSLSLNNEYWLTKLAFYCMWCHPALKLAWALNGCDKSGHVQEKRVK